MKQLDAGLELLELHIEAIARPRAEMIAQPNLLVDRDRMQVADADLRPRLRDRG